MNTFYLVRHADVVWTPDENRSLSECGHQDAKRAAEILLKFPISVIYSSPYLRARQTIAPLSSHLEIDVQSEPDLRERRMSEGQIPDFLKVIEATWEDFSFAYPGGESNSAAQQRGVAVLLRINQLHQAEHIVISTHGNLLALMLNHFEPSIDFNFWKSMTFPDVYQLKIKADGQAVIHRLWDGD
ncbi:MAG: histidine phosphatase family protein [Anaerolineales bacterium]